MRARKGLRWLLAGALAAVSCSMPRMHYYTMEFPHASPAAVPGVARQIAVQGFRADQVFTDERILFRESPDEVSYYENHRWASPPGEMIANYFIHLLKDSGFYAGVSAYKDGPQADFILQGRIHHFEEVDRGKEVLASVELEIELLNGKTRAPIWRGEEGCSKPVATRDMTGVIQGIHSCLDETAAKLLSEMHKQIEKSAGR